MKGTTTITFTIFFATEPVTWFWHGFTVFFLDLFSPGHWDIDEVSIVKFTNFSWFLRTPGVFLCDILSLSVPAIFLQVHLERISWPEVPRSSRRLRRLQGMMLGDEVWHSMSSMSYAEREEEDLDTRLWNVRKSHLKAALFLKRTWLEVEIHHEEGISVNNLRGVLRFFFFFFSRLMAKHDSLSSDLLFLAACVGRLWGYHELARVLVRNPGVIKLDANVAGDFEGLPL